MAIRQEGTVIEYHRKFKVSTAPLRVVPEEVLEGIFVNGLKAKVHTELRLLKLVGLGEIMEICQKIEEKNVLLHQEVAETRFSRPQYRSGLKAGFLVIPAQLLPIVE